jgi:hypothetical protein
MRRITATSYPDMKLEDLRVTLAVVPFLPTNVAFLIKRASASLTRFEAVQVADGLMSSCSLLQSRGLEGASYPR